ncbi:hypothetical protein Lfu02_58890 [Longispora fulva]|uniref:Putative peptidoglycan lipid II flippase n=1 Tax=Longispora fulva TaxID=619741 RepID=A0A8J7GQL7_9ACTN|nr:lipid II flippase MurJ [Longispora fulva]MBG6137129.1 putative peptidoglycan lipid II flippase [Longispora fulva]GIG61517.1 hypothetical protein Lfu02_58890 [Longispora fulva]
MRAGPADSAAAVTGDSISVACWTAVSRATGVLRFAMVGAVLGPTYFGNTYQFTNSLPNLVFYGFLGGSLFSSLLVPALVRHIDLGDGPASRRLAGGFLGMALLGLAALAPLAVALGPLALRGGQEATGRLLVALFVPQIFCYGLIATSVAVMNAHRRFALAAAAPALENAGILAVLAGYASGVGGVLFLGLGTTGAVGLHAAVQWWGAGRVGVTLVPRAGWRDPEARKLLRRALPSVAQAGLAAGELLILLVLANRIPGGVVAFQLALSFVYVANALGAAPVALSMLPRLARMHLDGDAGRFAATLARGLGLGLFVTVPTAAFYLVLAAPLARVVALGRMGTAAGVTMVALALAALAAAVVGETVFWINTYACYARGDTGAPLRSTVVQVGTSLAVACVGFLVPGPALLVVLGLAYSAGAAAGGTHLARHVRRVTAARPGDILTPGTAGTRLAPGLGRTVAGAVVMAGPAWLTAVLLRGPLGPAGRAVGLVAALAVAVAVFVGTQSLLRSPELAEVAGGMSHLLGRTSRPVAGVRGG